MPKAELISRLLTEWLEDRGYLPQKSRATQSDVHAHLPEFRIETIIYDIKRNRSYSKKAEVPAQGAQSAFQVSTAQPDLAGATALPCSSFGLDEQPELLRRAVRLTPDPSISLLFVGVG